MSDTNVRRSEDAAEQRSVTGWVCRHCGQFWGDDERMARYCCATDFPCECGGRHEKTYTCCNDCRRRKDTERSLSAWEKAPRKPWDEGAMLYSERCDRYFVSLAEAYEWLGDRDGTPQDMEWLRLYICEPNNGRCFDMADYLCDDLPEDEGLDCDDINQIVNDWIAKHGPFSWTPGKYALEVRQ